MLSADQGLFRNGDAQFLVAEVRIRGQMRVSIDQTRQQRGVREIDLDGVGWKIIRLRSADVQNLGAANEYRRAVDHSSSFDFERMCCMDHLHHRYAIIPVSGL